MAENGARFFFVRARVFERFSKYFRVTIMPRRIQMLTPYSAGVNKTMKHVRFKKPKQRVRKLTEPEAALNPTAMGRLVDEHIAAASCADVMQTGLDWHQKPRSTRTSPRTASVTRKTHSSVTATSKEAEEMLSAVMGGANLATKHRKRKTLQVDDVNLVLDIASRVGSYGALLS
jgi:histone H3/H4